MDDAIKITDDCDVDGNRWVLEIALGEQYAFIDAPENDGPRFWLAMGTAEAIQLFLQMEESGIAGYVREMRAAEREWNRMTTFDRARALGESMEAGYSLDDPKHPTYASRMLDEADRRRKEARES